MPTKPLDKDELFNAAADIDDPQQRAAFLDEACAGDAALRREIDALLKHDDVAESFLQQPAIAGGDDTQPYRPITEGPGTKIGPYTLREQIGEGGFGLVFVAEQHEPVRRKVALKIIKPGMDTKEVISRFEAERQALALMDHPNVARIFDAGTTDSGRPYFVMELVKGIPITEYCDQQKLTTAERLDLFVTVCRAVQHAHGKGVIHRDLKPNNILIAPHDGVPVVKIIDFGVAKAIGPQLTDKTIYTGYLQMIGTPLYMSPEQAEINQLDIDTRSDVYSLGVLLYELLTGATPFDRQRFSTAAFDEIRRIIKEEEPPRPSLRLSTLGETLSQVSQQRKTDPAKLTASVRGDLDWIVMKALEKDRSRRYETASALAADVGRYLSEEAIEARPPSIGYRFAKFTLRNRAAFTTVALVLVVMLLGTVVSAWQAVRANAEAERANTERDRALAAETQAQIAMRNQKQVSDLFLTYLIRQVDPAESQDTDLRLRVAVERFAKVLKPGRHDPLVEAQLRVGLGEAFFSLSNRKMAGEQLKRAVEILRNERGPNDPETVRAETLAAIADAMGYIRRKEDPPLVAAIERCRKLLPEDDPMTLRARYQLGWFRGLQGLLLWTTYRQSLRPDARRLYDEGMKILRDVLERRKERLGRKHPDTLRTAGLVGYFYNLKGETRHKDMYRKAVDHLEPLLKTTTDELGPKHPLTLSVQASLGSALRVLGQPRQSIELLKEACEARIEVLGPAHVFTLSTRHQLARSYMDSGNFELAEELLKTTRSTHDQTFGFFFTATRLRGLCKLKRKQWAEAEGLFRKLMNDDDRKDAVDKVTQWIRHTIQIRLGQALTGQGVKRFKEAEKRLLAGYAGLQKDLAEITLADQNRDDPILNARQALVDLYTAWKKPAEAAKWKKQLDAWPAEKERLLKRRNSGS